MRSVVCFSLLAVACGRAGAEQAPVGSAGVAPSAVTAAARPAKSNEDVGGGARRTGAPLAVAKPEAPPHPLAELSKAELVKLLEADPKKLGTASVGEPNRGQLWGGVQAESNELWEVVEPDRAWATPATLAGLTRAIRAVHEEFPGTPRLHLGDLSRERGGYLRPHRSHQSGLDADVSYYYAAEQKWYQKATKQNLDRPRTWALVRALTSDPSVEYVFVDITVQRMLRAGGIPVNVAAVGLLYKRGVDTRHGNRTANRLRCHLAIGFLTARFGEFNHVDATDNNVSHVLSPLIAQCPGYRTPDRTCPESCWGALPR